MADALIAKLVYYDATRRQALRWTVRMEKGNWLKCSCNFGYIKYNAAHLHYSEGSTVGQTCSHIDVLYTGRFGHRDRFHSGGIDAVLVQPAKVHQLMAPAFWVDFTEKGAKMFHWRWAAHALKRL